MYVEVVRDDEPSGNMGKTHQVALYIYGHNQFVVCRREREIKLSSKLHGNRPITVVF